MSATASQMDYVLPNELVDGMITAGGKKATVSVKNLLVRGFYSGAILGLAVILALTVGLKSGQPWLGSLLFPFGFASIVLFGMELVTGNFALLPMATWAGKSTWGATFRNWGWVWLGNWIGTAVVALLMAISLTSGGTVDPASAADGGGMWQQVAAKIIALNKTNVVTKYENLQSLGFFLAFLRGLIANWLVCLGVTMALVSKSVPGKIGLLAADHSIPNHGNGAHRGEHVPAHRRTHAWFRRFLWPGNRLELHSSHPRQHHWRDGVYRHALLQHPSHPNEQRTAYGSR